MNFENTKPERHRLILVSGKYFDYGEEYFRVGLGRKNFSDVLEILEKAQDEFEL